MQDGKDNSKPQLFSKKIQKIVNVDNRQVPTKHSYPE